KRGEGRRGTRGRKSASTFRRPPDSTACPQGTRPDRAPSAPPSACGEAGRGACAAPTIFVREPAPPTAPHPPPPPSPPPPPRARPHPSPPRSPGPPVGPTPTAATGARAPPPPTPPALPAAPPPPPVAGGGPAPPAPHPLPPPRGGGPGGGHAQHRPASPRSLP